MSDQFWLTKARLKHIEPFFPRTRVIPRDRRVSAQRAKRRPCPGRSAPTGLPVFNERTTWGFPAKAVGQMFDYAQESLRFYRVAGESDGARLLSFLRNVATTGDYNDRNLSEKRVLRSLGEKTCPSSTGMLRSKELTPEDHVTLQATEVLHCHSWRTAPHELRERSSARASHESRSSSTGTTIERALGRILPHTFMGQNSYHRRSAGITWFSQRSRAY